MSSSKVAFSSRKIVLNVHSIMTKILYQQEAYEWTKYFQARNESDLAWAIRTSGHNISDITDILFRLRVYRVGFLDKVRVAVPNLSYRLKIYQPTTYKTWQEPESKDFDGHLTQERNQLRSVNLFQPPLTSWYEKIRKTHSACYTQGICDRKTHGRRLGLSPLGENNRIIRGWQRFSRRCDLTFIEVQCHNFFAPLPSTPHRLGHPWCRNCEEVIEQYARSVSGAYY